MKYVAPKAELVSLELNSVILLSLEQCFIYNPDTHPGEGGGDDKLPDYDLYN